MAVGTTPISVITTVTPPAETPAEFVARMGLKVDDAWRAWNALEDRPRLSREAFRDAWRAS